MNDLSPTPKPITAEADSLLSLRASFDYSPELELSLHCRRVADEGQPLMLQLVLGTKFEKRRHTPVTLTMNAETGEVVDRDYGDCLAALIFLKQDLAPVGKLLTMPTSTNPFGDGHWILTASHGDGQLHEDMIRFMGAHAAQLAAFIADSDDDITYVENL